jgi:hypothetical protein
MARGRVCSPSPDTSPPSGLPRADLWRRRWWRWLWPEKKHSAKSGIRGKADLMPTNEIRQEARIATELDSQTSHTFFKAPLDRISKRLIVQGPTLVGWKNTGNPYYVWQTIEICIREKINLPYWVNQYLAECAQRMLSPDATKSRDLGRVLPRIMGFPQKRGPGHSLEPDRESHLFFKPAWTFLFEIEKGKKPTAALRSAFEVLDQEVCDKMENKTLLRHIKKFFFITEKPRTNAEWKRALHGKITEKFGPFMDEIREISS